MVKAIEEQHPREIAPRQFVNHTAVEEETARRFPRAGVHRAEVLHQPVVRVPIRREPLAECPEWHLHPMVDGAGRRQLQQILLVPEQMPNELYAERDRGCGRKSRRSPGVASKTLRKRTNSASHC